LWIRWDVRGGIVDELDQAVEEIAQTLVIGSARGSRKGRPTHGAVLSMARARVLDEGDLPAILNPEVVGSQTPTVLELRHGHHTIARLLADGTKQVEISAITGYSQSRISILKGDPAFQELIEYYKTQKEAIYLDVHQRLGTLAITAVEELQQRMDEQPGRISNKEVREIAEMALDRSLTKGVVPGRPGGTNLTIQFVQPTPEGDRATSDTRSPILDLDSEEVP
jgi:hypothetical protein